MGTAAKDSPWRMRKDSNLGLGRYQLSRPPPPPSHPVLFLVPLVPTSFKQLGQGGGTASFTGSGEKPHYHLPDLLCILLSLFLCLVGGNRGLASSEHPHPNPTPCAVGVGRKTESLRLRTAKF